LLAPTFYHSPINNMKIHKNSEGELLTLQDVANTFKVSKSTIYRLIEQRKLPFRKVKGGLRFSRNDIEAFLEGCRVDAIK